ncbi:MAG: EthD domain-containing protein [Steroidobacteraceae bacterium]
MTEAIREWVCMLAILTVREGCSLPQLRSALAQQRASLQQRFGPHARVLLGTRRADDPFSAIGASQTRQIESLDALLQVTWPITVTMDAIMRPLRGLGSELSAMVDVAKSSLVLGRALVLVEMQGDVFCGFVGRRRPDLTVEQMRRHWLDIHAPLAIRLTGTVGMHGYVQVHVDRASSEAASTVAGLPFVPYDMGDSLEIPDLERFLQAFADPEIGRQLYEDEKNFLDHSSWRGAFTDKIV